MSAQSTVRELIRERGPLTVDELVQLARGTITSKNPKQTIRNTLKAEPSIEPGPDDRYVYFPRFIQGACVRQPMDLAAPDRQLLAIGSEASALLWPEYARGESMPAISLENGPTVRLTGEHPWPGQWRAVVRLPANFWRWWAEQTDADALLLCCLDGEAAKYSAHALKTATLDAEEVAARNAEVCEVAAAVMRRSHTMTPGDLARRLLSRGIYHRSPPPDAILELLLKPGSPFVRQHTQIVYRPEITPAMWRLFMPRLAEDRELEERIVRAGTGLLPDGDKEEIIEEEMAWPEPPPIPADAGQQGYRLRVKLSWQPRVWRDIEIRGDDTLGDLHLTIQDAFNWDNDHLYAFYLSGKRYDTLTEIGGPTEFGEENPPLTDEVALAHLELKRGQKFLYLFDFGDDLEHQIEVMSTFIPEAGVTYPRIVEEHGEAPPQYPTWDEEDEWDGDDEGGEDEDFE